MSTVDLTLGQSVSFSIGTEIEAASAEFAVTTAGAPSFSLGTEVTGGANVSPTTAGQITVGLGEETPFGKTSKT